MNRLATGLKLFFIVTLAIVSYAVFAKPPPNAPPRGRAYGYYLQDGGRVLFLYLEEDGSRLIELSLCHQNRRYAIEATEDLKSWRALTVVTIQADGKASFRDTEPQAHRFYRVIRSN